MTTSTIRVFTIPASVPFLPRLIKALAEGRLVPGFPAARDPLALAQATLYLPTRRAERLARALFLDAIGGEAAILPRIIAIGDVDEDEIVFAESASGELANDALELPEALGGFERRMLLAELILKWAAMPEMRGETGASLVAHSPAAALLLADDLARLMDDMTTRQVLWGKLDGLVPDDLDEYWQLTLKFLKIAREAWPAVLAERGKIEPAERRDRLIAAEAARLAASTSGPVIAAGSTGSMPSTAMLLATIAKLPHGAVVLPGLDTHLDAAAWEMIAGDREGGNASYGHPQFAMQALLQRLGIGRDLVVELAPAAKHGSERLVSEALRPAGATERWQERVTEKTFSAHADVSLANLAMIEAGTPEDEALAIAVALREAVEEPGKTAALVTPDRALSRRVLAALTRWKVEVDDSGGEALADTPAGVFARLAADVALGGLTPVTLLALLKHPKFRLGAAEGAYARAIAVLELAILRGPRPKPGSDGLAHALSSFRAELEKFRRKVTSTLHRSDPRIELLDSELDAARELIARLKIALAPLEGVGAKSLAFAELAGRHRIVIDELTKDGGGTSAIFSQDRDDPLKGAFEEIDEYGRVVVRPADYPELFLAALSGRVVRRPEKNVRVRILGLLEARLQSVDRVVLGGLVEGVWPPEARADPWLSRPMRHALGLDLPERRIGLAAHDFAQALGHREVILTRASKLEGAPTVASRFVQRLAAVAGPMRWKAARERGERYLEFARELNRPTRIEPAKRPEPRPPLAARPLQLSVTEIEHWLRDPYTIYAKHILRLAPLDPVDTPPGAADRGTVIHAAIGEFTKAFADNLPADPAGALIAIGEQQFAALADYPEARAFWWPRFLRIARWFAGFEQARRSGIAKIYAEIGGRLDIPIGTRTFRLTVRADRIERLKGGDYTILDYKTGAAPSEKQVRTGFAPQLTLEAAMVRGGGFADIAAGARIARLVYVTLRGAEQAGEEKEIAFKDGTPDSRADNALLRLQEHAIRFENEAEPYRSLVHPMWKYRYSDYDHLARVKEWSLVEGADDGGAS
jgi:ATP-dependent helicase/nuclease subunit B